MCQTKTCGDNCRVKQGEACPRVAAMLLLKATKKANSGKK